MSVFTKLSNVISSVGENQNFIAFMAHAGTAQFVVSRFERKHRWVVAAVIVVTAIKEFWYDLRYEKNPPQTLKDSLLDFAGYMTGVVIGLF